ncbi:MAG: hypothetical protein WCK89_19125, partial [bacterium]
MGQTKPRVLDLAFARLAKQLQIHLVHHPQTCGSNRVTEAFQSAIGLNRQTTSYIEEAAIDFPLSFARADMELCFNRIRPDLRMPLKNIHFPAA